MMKQYLTENIVGIVIMGGVILFQYSKILFERNKEEIDKIKALNSKLYEEKKTEIRNKKSSYVIEFKIKLNWEEILKYYINLLSDHDVKEKFVCEEHLKQVQEQGRLHNEGDDEHKFIKDGIDYIRVRVQFDNISKKIMFWNYGTNQYTIDVSQVFRLYPARRKNTSPSYGAINIVIDEDSILIDEIPISFMPTKHVISEIIRHNHLDISPDLFVLSFSEDLEMIMSKCGVKYSVAMSDSYNYHMHYYDYILTRENVIKKINNNNCKVIDEKVFLNNIQDNNYCNMHTDDKSSYAKTITGMKLVDISNEDLEFKTHILANQFMTVYFSINFQDKKNEDNIERYNQSSSYYTIGDDLTDNPQSVIDNYKDYQLKRKVDCLV